MCVTSHWFSTKRHMRPIYYELKWIIPATLELNCWECCWVFEVFVELWPESLAFSVLVTNLLLSEVLRLMLALLHFTWKQQHQLRIFDTATGSRHHNDEVGCNETGDECWKTNVWDTYMISSDSSHDIPHNVGILLHTNDAIYRLDYSSYYI